jgi:cytochrome c553
MLKRCVLVLVALGCLPAAALAQEVEPGRLLEAAARAVAAIQKAQAPWYTADKQVCASCHHQYQPALALRVARDHGVPLDEAIARADSTKAFNFSDIDRAVQYTHVIEPAVDDAYRMVAAHAAGVKPNLGTAVYARLLISRQNEQGDWDGFHQRPPSSYSRVTMAALGLRALQMYHHASQKAQADAAVARANSSRVARLATPRRGPTSCSAFCGPGHPAPHCRSWRAI